MAKITGFLCVGLRVHVGMGQWAGFRGVRGEEGI